MVLLWSESVAKTMLLDHIQKPWNWRIANNLLPPELQEILPPRQERLCHLAHSHHHPWRQITIILIGEEYLVLGDRVFHSVPGTIAYLDGGETHGECAVKPALPETLTFRANFIDGRVFTRFYHHKDGGELEVPTSEDILLPPGIGNGLEACWDDLKRNAGVDVSLQRCKLVHATGSFLTEILDQQMYPHTGRGHSQKDLFDAIVQHLYKTAGCGATTATLAAMAGYSINHFARVFRSHTGKRVHEFIDECRIMAIRKMINQGSSQTDIAAALGFSDYTAYYHWRSKHFADGISNRRIAPAFRSRWGLKPIRDGRQKHNKPVQSDQKVCPAKESGKK